MVIEPQGWAVISILAAAFAGLIGAWAMSIRQNATARTYTIKNESDSDKALKDAQIEAQKTFIRIADRFASGQDTFFKLVTDNINANNQNAAELRGMLLMLDSQGKSITDVRNLVMGMNTHVTDLEGSFATQFGPVVTAIQSIGAQIDLLSAAFKLGDEATITAMSGLQSSFGSIESYLIKMLERLDLKTMGELKHETSENGKSTPSPINGDITP